MLERFSMRKHLTAREIPRFVKVNVNKVDICFYEIVLIQVVPFGVQFQYIANTFMCRA